MPNHGFPIKKSPIMHIAILIMWMMCVRGFVPSLYRVFERGTELASLHSRILVWLLLGLLCIFWLYGAFFFCQFLAAFMQKRMAPLPSPPIPATWPRVAILYTTFHDFQEDAVESCLRQKYPGEFKVFILDDSTRQEYKDRIDSFAAGLPDDMVRVVRRPAHNRTGYKAGNINYALRNEVTDFPYFAVFDADSIVPPDFLARIMPYFELDPSIAFLQGGHRPLPQQRTAFARDLCLWTEAVWNFMWLPKNRFGFVFFLGHGGVISYLKWKTLKKGFPELVSEDLAISVQFQQLGFRGWHIPHVFSYEEFPDDYRSFRKQQKKYVEGACEFMHREFGSYLWSRQPLWFEKLDLLLTCTSLFLPLFMTAFCVLFCIVIPWRFGLWEPWTISIVEGVKWQFPLLLQRDFIVIFTLPFLLAMLACSLGPAFGAISTIVQYRGIEMWRGVKLVFLSAVPFMSIFVMGAIAIASYFLSGKAIFGVTGDKTAKVNESAIDLFEQMFIIFCGTACILTANLTLLAPSIAMLFGLALRWDTSNRLWDSRLRGLFYIPFACVVIGLLILSAIVLYHNTIMLTTLPS